MKKILSLLILTMSSVVFASGPGLKNSRFCRQDLTPQNKQCLIFTVSGTTTSFPFGDSFINKKTVSGKVTKQAVEFRFISYTKMQVLDSKGVLDTILTIALDREGFITKLVTKNGVVFYKIDTSVN